MQKEVELRPSNERFVEIKSARKEGEIVAPGLAHVGRRVVAFGSQGKPMLRDRSKEEVADAATANVAPGAPEHPEHPETPRRPAVPLPRVRLRAGMTKGGFNMPPWMAKLSQEERRSLFTASDEEKRELAKTKGGRTDEQVDQEASKNGRDVKNSAAAAAAVPAAAEAVDAAAWAAERRRAATRIGPVNLQQGSGTSAGKPIVKLVDVPKIRRNGHAGGAGLASAAAESRPHHRDRSRALRRVRRLLSRRIHRDHGRLRLRQHIDA